MAALAEQVFPFAPGEEETPLLSLKSRYGPKNEKLPDQLRKAIESAFRKSQEQEQYSRRMEVLHDRKMRLYERGIQHIYQTADYGFAIAVPGQPFWNSQGKQEQWGDYIEDYPLFHGFLWIITAVLTQVIPGVDWQPNDPSKSVDVQAAQTAEGLRKHFDRMNDIKMLAAQIVRMMCLSGRYMVWVVTEENAARWGRDENGNPIRTQVAKVFGSLETKIPLIERDSSDFPYAIIYMDLDVRNAKDRHQHIATKIQGGEGCLGENNYERYARLGIMQGAVGQVQGADGDTHIVTEGHGWLRPSCFTDKEYDDLFSDGGPEDLVDGKPLSIRDAIAQVFQDENGQFTGMHAVYVGSNYSGSWPESMDDCLTFKSPFAGDGQSTQALMDPAVIAQDRFNSLMNSIAEIFDFGAPSTWVYAGEKEFAAITKQSAQWYNFRQMQSLAPGTNSVADNMFREEAPEVPPSMESAIRFLMTDFLQFVLACPPAMWGEASAGNSTASGLAQERASALGRMAVPYAVLQSTFAKVYYQVALAASRDPRTPEEIIVPVEGSQSLKVRPERLKKGRFMCNPDQDTGFPDSTAAKRSTLMNVLQLVMGNPEIQQQFFGSPSNSKEVLRTMGLNDIILPEAEAYDKQMQEIEQLLASSPIMPTQEEVAAGAQNHAMEQDAVVAQHGADTEMAVAQGLPGPAPPAPTPFDPASLVRPSVPVNPWDRDEWELACCDDYLNSKAARNEVEIGRPDPLTGEMKPNMAGIQNVWLHRQEHAKQLALKQPPMPMLPPEEPSKSGGGNKSPKFNGMTPTPEAGPPGALGTNTI